MCGVVGLLITDQNLFSRTRLSAVGLTLEMLSKLQHRGQDAAGLSYLTQGPSTFKSYRGLGLIGQALRDISSQDIEAKAQLTVAHTRYATTGTGGVGEVQPFIKGIPHIAIAHNGNIVNTQELVEKFHIHKETDSDLEVISQLFLRTYNETESGHELQAAQTAVQKLYDELNGSYSVVCGLENKKILAWRDPWGLRPLFMARFKGGVAFASETCAFGSLSQLEPEIEEIAPSTVVFVDEFGRESQITLKSQKNRKDLKRFCMFESIYFSSPQSEFATQSGDSRTASQSVFRSRMKLGEYLGKQILKNAMKALKYDNVVPVPETSRTAAIVVAEVLKIPYREFLVKSPYVSRTFILNSQEARLSTLKNKLILIGPEVKGQNILLVDDSVVRGNTSRLMALKLKEAGAKNVGLASTCPPIQFGCFYGIDFPDEKELVASGKSISEIANSLGVDELFYLAQEDLVKALSTENLCMACLDGDYPTRDQSFESFLKKRQGERSIHESR
jgi:amidophosphoribosyltransferase